MSTPHTAFKCDRAASCVQMLAALSQELPEPKILATVSRESRKRIGMELRGFALICEVGV